MTIRAVEQGRQSPIGSMARLNGKLILQGVQGTHLTLIIAEDTGQMSATIAGAAAGYIIFGSCTQLEPGRGARPVENTHAWDNKIHPACAMAGHGSERRGGAWPVRSTLLMRTGPTPSSSSWMREPPGNGRVLCKIHQSPLSLATATC